MGIIVIYFIPSACLDYQMSCEKLRSYGMFSKHMHQIKDDLHAQF